MGSDAIDGMIVGLCVYIPDDTAIFGRVSPEVTVEAAGEHDVRDRSDGGRLSGAASGNPVAAGVRRVPDLLPCLQPKCVKAATLGAVQQKRHIWIEHRRLGPGRTQRNYAKLYIRDGDVKGVAVSR